MAAAVALALFALGGLPPQAGAAEGLDAKKVKLDVGQQCVAPSGVSTNACTIQGRLAGLGVGGADIVWMVTLFSNDQWRIQFQAFTEEPGLECQYPIQVKGAYSAPGLAETTFSSKVGLALGIRPGEFPQVTLSVDQVGIDPGRATCG